MKYLIPPRGKPRGIQLIPPMPSYSPLRLHHHRVFGQLPLANRAVSGFTQIPKEETTKTKDNA